MVRIQAQRGGLAVLLGLLGVACQGLAPATRELSQTDPVAQFVETAQRLEHLTDIRYARDCRDLEAAAMALREEELKALLEDPRPVIRAAAVAGSYLADRVALLPQVVSMIEDEGEAPPFRQIQNVAIVQHPDGSIGPSGPPYVKEPQTVGDVARTVLRAHYQTAAGRYQVPDPRFRKPERHAADFVDYWQARRDRADCLGWLTMAINRATGGSSPPGNDYRQRVKAVRQRIDGIESPYRDWLLLALSTPWLGGDALMGMDGLATHEDRIAAARAIGEPALRAFLSGQSPDVSDPDCQLGEHSIYPYERVATFVLQHAPELLPNATTEWLLDLEARHLRGEPVGLAPRHFATSLWTVAAADLHPEGAVEILRGGFQHHAANKYSYQQDRRAYLAMALWRHAGERELPFLLDWFFQETPSKNSFGFGRHRVVKACQEGAYRPLLRALLQDARLSTLDPWSFAHLAQATNQALDRTVWPFDEARRKGPTAFAIRALREAW